MVAMGSSPESDWYGILGISPAASRAEIGRAFRVLARRYHPDVGSDPSDPLFAHVARAYEVLGHPSSRAVYDDRRRGFPPGGMRMPVRRWAAGASQSPAVDASPTDEDSDQPTDLDLSISFIESITGTVARVDVPRTAICTVCCGTGSYSPGRCPTCGGKGRRQRQSGSITITHICTDCDGFGRLRPQACTDCAGRGWRQITREVTLRIPPGVTDSTKLRLRSPADGHPAGFARVRILPDPWFSRQGRDIVLRLPLNVSEAVLGTTIAASMPDGKLEIEVPPGTGPGDTLRIPGRGAPGTERGDLVLTVEVVLPEDPTASERAAWEALARVSGHPRSGWPGAITADAAADEG
jgi:molecular chaperone DnaJ